jgi:hypothetical protein
VWRAWKERAGWVRLWRRSCAEVVEDECHILYTEKAKSVYEPKRRICVDKQCRMKSRRN